MVFWIFTPLWYNGFILTLQLWIMMHPPESDSVTLKMETTGSSKITEQTQTTEMNNPEEPHCSNILHENLTT
jgi:hypothetical protein